MGRNYTVNAAFTAVALDLDWSSYLKSSTTRMYLRRPLPPTPGSLKSAAFEFASDQTAERTAAWVTPSALNRFHFPATLHGLDLPQSAPFSTSLAGVVSCPTN
jgi:hypothetical protein